MSVENARHPSPQLKTEADLLGWHTIQSRELSDSICQRLAYYVRFHRRAQWLL